MPHIITTAERRHCDYLRRRGLQVGNIYEKRLVRARRKELRRVLDIAKMYDSPEMVAPVIQANIDESSYLPEWWTGLWVTAGVPMAKSTAKTLMQAKAAADDALWTTTLRRYAKDRAGSEIVSVSGTWKDILVDILRDILTNETNIGVEALTAQLYYRYCKQMERWMCRRIAQTETMIGLAEAADMSAQTLDVAFTKQWAISGLGNTRESHEMMDGIEVDQNEPFSLPGGQMMYPHDCSMGAAASEIINCACDCIRRPK